MSRSGQLGVGVIGCGTIAYWAHLRSLTRMPQVRVVGIADPDPVALERAATLVNARTYDNAETLLASEGVDAVVIASPSALHAEHVLAACAESKHVYLEKPLAIDEASASNVADTVLESSIVFAVGFNYRFHPLCQRGRQLLLSGLIGTVKAVISSFSEPETGMPQWKRKRITGGGVLLDLGVHHLDLYRWFLNDEPTTIQAQIESEINEQDTAIVSIRTQRGIRISGYFSFTSSRSNYLEFHGDRGVLRLDLHQGTLDFRRPRRRGYGVSRQRLATPLAEWPWRIRKLIRPSYDPSHERSLQSFIKTVIGDNTAKACLASVNDGLFSLQTVLQAEASATQSTGLQPVRT